MKKSLLVAAMAVLGFTTVNAQELKFGVKAGVNIASIGADDDKSRVAYHFGVVAEMPVSEKFSIQPELLYSSQGAKADFLDSKLRLNYINLPIKGKFYFTDGFSINAGPQIGYLVRGIQESDGYDNLNVTDEYEKIDFGLNFGLEYIDDNNLSFGVGYNLGLSKILDESILKNRVFQISVGYFFN